MRSPAARLAYAAFFLFFLYVIFFKQMPFQERRQQAGVDAIVTSNRYKQIAYMALFCMAVLALAPKRTQVWQLICAEKWFALFLLWCVLSIGWSEFRFVSFKRLFQVVTSVMVITAFLLHGHAITSALKLLQWHIGVYLCMCLIAVLLIPQASEPMEAGWRGLAPTKNQLGQAGLVGLLLWTRDVRDTSPTRRGVALGMMGLAGLILLGSRSMTALLAAVFTGTIALAHGMVQRLDTLGIGRIMAGLLLVWGLAVALVVYLEPGMVEALLGSLGRDTTFTGRTELWVILIDEAKQHWLFGCGFDAFWVVEYEVLQMLYATQFFWLPNQGHNGYLDLWNEIGVVGLVLFFGMVLWYFRRVGQSVWAQHGKWLCLSVLVMNLMESTLFRLNNITGILFIFAYLSLCIEVLQTQKQKSTAPHKVAHF